GNSISHGIGIDNSTVDDTKKFNHWISDTGSTNSGYTGDDNLLIFGVSHSTQGNYKKNSTANDSSWSGMTDASNNDGFVSKNYSSYSYTWDEHQPQCPEKNSVSGDGTLGWYGSTPESRSITGVTIDSVPNSTFSYDSFYSESEQHFQLAKNIGYVLINARGLNEKDSKSLSKYQLPTPTLGSSNQLNSIANHNSYWDGTQVRNFLKSFPVNDDEKYRGGLLGVMSIYNGITGNGATYTSAYNQEKASSIYNDKLVGAGKYLKVPGTEDSFVKIDGAAKGSKYNDTDLRYGLAWNDSSDLPQVKIERSLNAQYLVPVSVARIVKTTRTQYNVNGTFDSRLVPGTTDQYTHTWTKYPDYYRTKKIKYGDYKLYLGDVILGNADADEVDCNSTTGEVKKNGEVIGQNYIETTSVNNSKKYNYINTQNATLANLKPVNNQIKYERIDTSYPHYDSELFDHGSNRKSITATHHDNNNKEFVGTSKEKEDKTDKDNVGSSDDYSIGIVHAPGDLFEVKNDTGVPTTANGELTLKNSNEIDSTENRADGKQHSINKFTDAPENSNGMSIGKADSYTTLAKAYNVDIVNGKAVGKADDQAKNKDDRVALVQQLL
ncbi:MAG: hypothetical protein ACRCZW_10005, partial [Lactobacillaceae bacterium]